MWAGALIAVAALVYARRDTSTDDSHLTSGAASTQHAAAAEPDPDVDSDSDADGDSPEGAGEASPALTMYRGGARHQARSAAVGPREPEQRFAFETGGMIKAQAVRAANGNLYVASLGSPGHGIGEPPVSGALHVISEEGELVWRRELEGDIYSTPLVTQSGRVYIGSDSDQFWALGPDGTIRWRVRTEGDADTSPVLCRGVIYFGAGQELWAVREDGSVLWRFEAGSKIFTSPAVWRGDSPSEATIYFGSQDDHLYALAPDGTTRWSAEVGGDIDSSPVLGDDGTIYFGADDRRVYAYTPAGQRRFATELGGYIRAPVALSGDGLVVAGVMGPRPRIVALSAETGEERWEFRLPVTDSRELGVMSGPLLDATGAVYVGGHDDYVYGLSPGGELRWAHAVTGDVDAPPSLGPDGVLYVGADDGKLYALADP